MASINIVGWTSNDKDPTFARQTTYGAGASSIGANPKKLVLLGNKTSAGSKTEDADVDQVLSADDADTFYGAGSELAMMCYAALAIPGVTLYGCPVAEAGGAAAAVATITIAGTWSTAGSIYFWLAGRRYSVSVASGDAVGDVATAIAAAFSAISRSPVTAGAALGVATLTTKSKSARQKDWVLDVDLTDAPSGLTCTLAGGSARSGLAYDFGTGSGADDITNALALLTTDRYDYIALAQYDSTNLGYLKTQLDSEAGPLIAHLEHAGVASARAAATAETLSATTINHQRVCNPLLTNSQWPPSMLAACVMAARSVEESSNPNFNFDGYKLPIPAQRNKADIAGHTTRKALLNSGVTPLQTQPDGTVTIARGIVTHCKNGSAYDYSTLDWGDAVVPDYISDTLSARWTVVKQNNPYAGDNPASDERPVGSGVVTPDIWNANVYAVLKDAEEQNYVESVEANLPESQWDGAAHRILTACPVVVRTLNHQAGVDVRQTAAS